MTDQFKFPRGLLSICSFCLLTLASCSQMGRENSMRLGTGENIERTRLESQVQESATVFRKLLTAQDGGVPEQLLRNARCITIMPSVVKAAFIGGGRYGRGVVTCKDRQGQWTPPAFVTLTGGSIGWQIGAESADLVLFFTGEDAKAAVLSSNGLTLGADIGVSAGPIGRTADLKTNFSRTGIFSYAHSRGIFAGLSLEGSVMAADTEANKMYYGKRLTTADLILEQENLNTPRSAEKLLALLPKG